MSNIKHNHAIRGKVTKTYRVWIQMKNRCNNPNSKYYKNYGGREIQICSRWNKFENFLIDMGERPDGLVIDRIDNNGNYEPSNCRWTDYKTSNRNTRVVKLSIDKANIIREMRLLGFKLREIAEKFNISLTMVYFIVNRKYWQ